MYTEKAPTYDALQWTGDNAQELTDAILAEVSDGFYEQTLVGEDGELIIGLKYGMSLTILPLGWIVTAPGWGTLPRKYWATGSVLILTNAGFQERFTSV